MNYRNQFRRKDTISFLKDMAGISILLIFLITYKFIKDDWWTGFILMIAFFWIGYSKLRKSIIYFDTELIKFFRGPLLTTLKGVQTSEIACFYTCSNAKYEILSSVLKNRVSYSFYSFDLGAKIYSDLKEVILTKVINDTASVQKHIWKNLQRELTLISLLSILIITYLNFNPGASESFLSIKEVTGLSVLYYAGTIIKYYDIKNSLK